MLILDIFLCIAADDFLAANGFYGGAMNSNGMNFPFQQQSGGYHTGYPPSSANMHSGFNANNAYWAPQASSGPQATSFSLGGLLGAHRAQQFDPQDYGSFRPHLDGYESMHHNPGAYGGMGGAGGGVAVAAPYQNPHELAQSIRTKNDLSQVHAMLKEMHQAALNHQPMVAQPAFHEPGPLESDRGSGSPPESLRSIPSVQHYTGSQRSTTSPTPSLTPGSSVHSYQHSPAHDYVLPSTQAPAVSYPSLPGATTASMGARLGQQYDMDPRYRQYQGPLGKAQASGSSKAEGSNDSESTLDPALRGIGNATSEDKDKEDEPQRDGSSTPTPPSPATIAARSREAAERQATLLDSWIKAVQERLEAGDYEEEDDEQEDSSDHEMPDADEPSKDEPSKAEAAASDPSYPDLPMPPY